MVVLEDTATVSDADDEDDCDQVPDADRDAVVDREPVKDAPSGEAESDIVRETDEDTCGVGEPLGDRFR